jgi:hypothetical protein
MKAFNGRSATEEYMSTHSLTFSTPEMTLRKFALWLGEQVTAPGGGSATIPRLTLYLEDIADKKKSRDFAPDIDDTFRPSGAVTDMYGKMPTATPGSISSSSPSSPAATSASTGDSLSSSPGVLGKESSPRSENVSGESAIKYCIECGSNLKPNSKFCKRCGAKQV